MGTASLVVNATEVRRLHCIKGRTPLLKSLTVANSGSWEWENLFTPTDPEFIDAFEDSPSLMDLNLYMPIKGWKFHWSSIVVLWLGLENTENLAVALSQSTRLERLEVEWRGVSTDLDSVPIDAAQSMITLSSLKKMRLPWNVLNMLEVLTAPRLEHLFVRFGHSNLHDAAGIVAAFLRRSSCPLGRLELDAASPAAITEILSVVPGLPSQRSVSTITETSSTRRLVVISPRMYSD